MISAPVGSTLNVSGSSIAMVAIGPTPGSTPINVPTRQPRKQSARLTGDSAVAKPSPRLPIRSNMGPSSVAHQPRRQRDRQPECKLEQPNAERGHYRPRHKRFAPADLFASERADHDGEWPGDNQAERTHSGTESDHCAKNENGTAERPAIEGGTPSFHDGVGGEQHPEQAKQHREAARQHSRPHAAKGSDGQIRALPESEGGDRDHY